MNQADPIHAAMRKPLRQILLTSLLAAPLLALANGPSAKAEWMLESSDKAWALEDAGLLQQHTPHGHAWGFWALSGNADEHRAPQSFKEAATEVPRPTITETLTSPVPEPASYALVLAGLAATIGLFIRRRRQD